MAMLGVTVGRACRRTGLGTAPFSNQTFQPPTYSPAVIYFGRERGWWITCNYPTVLKEKNRKSITCVTCWLKSVLHAENRREQENHDFTFPDAVPRVVPTLANR
jgi:hypothetical protein